MNQIQIHMNKILKSIITTAIVIKIVLLQVGIGQEWSGETGNKLWNNWSVSFNGGLTSYFGDLSVYDQELSGKLINESGPAISGILTKQIKNVFGISGQIIYGNVKGKKNNISITSKLLEYNLHARINFVNLFSSKKNHKFGFVGYAGLGNFVFRTTKIVLSEGNKETTYHQSRVPEFVYFLGGGLSYKISQYISATADITLHQCQNDKLDNTVANNDFDYYSFINIGFTYHLKRKNYSVLRNKARIAHGGYKLASLNR